MEQRLSRALRTLAGLAARLQQLRGLTLQDLSLKRLSDPRILRAAAPYAALGVGVLLVIGLTWHSVASGGSENAGFPVKCSASDCGYRFAIARDQVQTYPRGPAGEGFKCKRCGRFTGQMAARCSKCGEWFVVTSSNGCPKCNNTPPPARPPARSR